MKLEKTETEIMQPIFYWDNDLIERWKPGNVYTAAAFVQPRRSNGFEYEVTSEGQSSSREPVWPTTIGATVNDGSVEWTCRDHANQASDSIATAGVELDTGLTAGAVTIIGNSTRMNISGGVNKSFYEVRPYITLTTTGERIEALLNVEIDNDRKR